MLKPQVQSQCSQSTLFLSNNKPFINGDGSSIGSPLLQVSLTPSVLVCPQNKNLRVAFSPGNIKASSSFPRIFSRSSEKITRVTANVTVQRKSPKPVLEPNYISEKLQSVKDKADDFLGVPDFSLELISAEIDPETGKQRKVKGFPEKSGLQLFKTEVKYETTINVPINFGEVGAIIVESDFEREIYIKDITLSGLPSEPRTLNFSCNSWVQSKRDVRNPAEHLRIFFSDKSYLPSQTPSGLRKLRKEELEKLRGDGKGQRKKYDRVYDYDVYNDLGKPDAIDTKRPVLGGKQHPYPRRGRTGRPLSQDQSSESRSGGFYVPRDEAFSEVKQTNFIFNLLFAVTHAISPILKGSLTDNKFPYFTSIDVLYNEGIKVPYKIGSDGNRFQLLKAIGSRVYKAVLDADDMLQFKQPPPMDKDKFFWFRDEEFARQTLGGLNPCSLQAAKEWPLRSKLDAEVYGPQESKITPELIEKQLKPYEYTFRDAKREKKLYMLDYHDILLPYVSKVRKLQDRTLYGSRTLFFLTPHGTLMPLAIELTRPQMDGKPQWKEVFTPNDTWRSTDTWLWRLAKAHVLAHDCTYHQLVSHWLRTHCAVEPYIIATNRQLSAMHPINRLLGPHFRYTMEINAKARDKLVSAGGIIEQGFALGQYVVEFSSLVYDKQWRFDLQALPADLIHRGLAVEDKSSEHGVRLTIEDYPFANDGLLIWDAIKNWVTEYVNHYYPNSSEVERDEELQEWWREIKTKGHPDKKEGWPDLKTPEDLIEIVSNIAWVASGLHAAVNFGQYAYAGYFPNRPANARANIPLEEKEYNPQVWKDFKENPEDALLRCFPSPFQAGLTVAVMDALSTHSPDEEYLGHTMETAWGLDPAIKAAFGRFNARVKEIENIIDRRNADENLNNRHGAGIMPYELLKPLSPPGVTHKGVPYSISI
ncbi:linoleate 13S-lipoxygenase 2-1, chloroplastic-like [Humulus lupulus]|uniref:linoleate 13S-lipoxygenase 2-1, chloroplastic-like n=1 Tax=Humulus lupulus TaxID=3486 RepID=UPI002B40AAC6|nr:linoleate 13S-lipoxygenase 2-1, chloroplastic-like [Humulus lupulus]